MLKKICGLFLGLVVCAGSACVTPTHASSAHQVVIRYIQAAGVAGARDELIVIHNNTSARVEVTDWCLKNKTGISFSCFTATPEQEAVANGTFRYFLPAYGDMTIASTDHAIGGAYDENMYSFTYAVTSQSSGSIVNSADTISLVSETSEVVDTKAWMTAIPSGKALTRLLILPNIYAASNDTTDWQVGTTIPFIESTLQADIYDLLPEEPEEEPELIPEEPPVDTSQPLLISELLANPAGTDTGKEFIELYNPNPQDEVSLDTYALKIGEATPKTYPFPKGVNIPPGQYVYFVDTDLGLTFVNTSGFVQLLRNNIAVGDPVVYAAAKDDQSWALIDGTWAYTAHITPGAGNILPVEIEEIEEEVGAKPCADNQYRNPETGRCKLMAVATAPAPCKVGQERNPETNRCRNAVSASSEPTPCKEGQERNPETNRCRTIVKMTNANYGVKGVEERAGAQLSWYYIGTIILVVAAILTYGVWEWRHELGSVWQRIRKMFARHEA